MNLERLKYLKETVNLDYTLRHDVPQLYFTTEDLKWLVKQVEMLNNNIHVDGHGEFNISARDILLMLADNEMLKEENEKLKNADVERLEKLIDQLEHENQLLYGRLNLIRDLTEKEIGGE